MAEIGEMKLVHTAERRDLGVPMYVTLVPRSPSQVLIAGANRDDIETETGIVTGSAR